MSGKRRWHQYTAVPTLTRSPPGSLLHPFNPAIRPLRRSPLGKITVSAAVERLCAAGTRNERTPPIALVSNWLLNPQVPSHGRCHPWATPTHPLTVRHVGAGGRGRNNTCQERGTSQGNRNPRTSLRHGQFFLLEQCWHGFCIGKRGVPQTPSAVVFREGCHASLGLALPRSHRRRHLRLRRDRCGCSLDRKPMIVYIAQLANDIAAALSSKSTPPLRRSTAFCS